MASALERALVTVMRVLAATGYRLAAGDTGRLKTNLVIEDWGQLSHHRLANDVFLHLH